MSEKPSAGHQLHRETEAARVLLANFRDTLGDDAVARGDLVEGETNLLEAISAGIARAAEIEALETGLVGMLANAKARLDRLREQRDNLRVAMRVALELAEKKSIETPLGTVTLKPTPAQVEVIDETIIPSRFWKRAEPTLDKTALKAALKAHEQVPGAVLDNGSATIQLTFR